MLVLSVFPGIDLLGRAFEELGACVVRGPDVLWGGDIRQFHPPAGVFDGIIGGPPCQAFTNLAGLVRARGCLPRYGNLIPEFERVVAEARPRWWLMENVPQAPIPQIPGYITRHLLLDNRWVPDGEGAGRQARRRRFSFGTPDGRALAIEYAVFETPPWLAAPTITNTRTSHRPNGGHGERRSIPEMCALQGLPPDFLDHAPFTQEGKRRVIVNGVPLPLGRAVARAVWRAMGYAIPEPTGAAS